MAVQLPSSIFFLLLFSALNYSVLGQNPDDVEWKGNKRAIVLDDRNALGEAYNVTWSYGWMCGWTPHGLCFSPDRKGDIHSFYVIPFKFIETYVYCDQRPNLNVKEFGINAVILAHFSRSAVKDDFWRGMVRRYSQNGRGHVLSLTARTFFSSLGLNQVEETFHPSQVYLQGAHDACKFFKTDCLSSESCVPRRLSGMIWPGEYKCVCRSGWKQVRGRGCVDIDECHGSELRCGWRSVCVNTRGSYSCQCRTGYEGAKCDIDIDECQMKPCPDNSICKNAPGSFNCTCLSGFSGKGCSEVSGFGLSSEDDPIITFQVIKQHSVKEISIPRKKPEIVIRKAVHIRDSGHKEMAIMGSLMFALYVLGLCLYRNQKKKRARKRKMKKEKRNQELENEGDIPGSEVLGEEETISSSQLLADNEAIPSSQLLVDKETIPSSELLLDKETVPSSQLLIDEGIAPNSELLVDKETISSSYFGDKHISSNQSLKHKENVLSNEAIENLKAISSSRQTLDNNAISSSRSLENERSILSNVAFENRKTISNSQILTNKETTASSQSLENNIVSSKRSLKDKGVIPSNNDTFVENNETMARSQALVDGIPTTKSQSLDSKPVSSNQSLEKQVVLSSQSLGRESVIGNESLNKEVVLSNPSSVKDSSLSSQSLDRQNSSCDEAQESNEITNDKEVADRSASGESEA